jgi:hypothetical protein
LKNFAMGFPSVVPRIADNPFQIRKPRGEILPKTTGRERGEKAALARKSAPCRLTLEGANTPLRILRTTSMEYAVSTDVGDNHTSSRRRVTDYGGRYGCRGGATNGLVSTARLFFVRQLSNLSSAARLWSRGIRIVDPAPSTIKTLAARIPSLNFLSEMGTETELASAATSVLQLAAPAFMRTG